MRSWRGLLPQMKFPRAIRSRSVVVATAALAAVALLSTHGCGKPCGEEGLGCCDMDQCQGALVCGIDSTCAVPMRRDAGTPNPDAGCGFVGTTCCSGVCFGSLVCGAGDLCAIRSDVGEGCVRNSQCDARLCLPVDLSRDGGRNVCTVTCGDGGVCTPGWQCGPYPGVTQPICVCRASLESCNGLDDDCDGVVDGPAAQAWCAASDGGTCVNAACVP